jgi:hypothetical protein
MDLIGHNRAIRVPRNGHNLVTMTRKSLCRNASRGFDSPTSNMIGLQYPRDVDASPICVTARSHFSSASGSVFLDPCDIPIHPALKEFPTGWADVASFVE